LNESFLLTFKFVRAQIIEPDSVKLFSSRGYETPSHKLFMRMTVIVGDLLVYFPAVWYLVSVFYKNESRYKRTLAILFLNLHPALLLVDHGHFQYNSISIGFAFFAVAFILDGYDLIGSFFFCLSLNYKQMSLYYASAFFFYLLAKNFSLQNMYASFHATPRFSPNMTLSSSQSILKIASLALVVIATFALCWRPFLTMDSASIVLTRLFPVGRGLFEDKVANFWCSLSPVLRMKEYFDIPTLVKIWFAPSKHALSFCLTVTHILSRNSTVSTLAAMTPSGILTLRKPTASNFIWALVASSLSFFLFRYASLLRPNIQPYLLCSVSKSMKSQFYYQSWPCRC